MPLCVLDLTYKIVVANKILQPVKLTRTGYECNSEKNNKGNAPYTPQITQTTNTFVKTMPKNLNFPSFSRFPNKINA